MSTYRKLTDGDDPFGALPAQQMLDAVHIVKAMAVQEVLTGHHLPLALDELDSALDALRRRVISNEQACEWSDYRKAYGVSAHALSEAHKAFIAGWEAGQGKSFEGGPLR
jgi:hypothetical protein